MNLRSFAIINEFPKEIISHLMNYEDYLIENLGEWGSEFGSTYLHTHTVVSELSGRPFKDECLSF